MTMERQRGRPRRTREGISLPPHAHAVGGDEPAIAHANQEGVAGASPNSDDGGQIIG
jgi:hypothetical protein